MKDPAIYIDDMLEAIDAINRYTSGMDEVKFSQTDYIQDAVIRQLAIIGEAARNVPLDIQAKQPDVPWRKMVDFRNVIIHEYSGITLGRVWQIMRRDVPVLKKQLADLLTKLPPPPNP